MYLSCTTLRWCAMSMTAVTTLTTAARSAASASATQSSGVTWPSTVSVGIAEAVVTTYLTAQTGRYSEHVLDIARIYATAIRKFGKYAYYSSQRKHRCRNRVIRNRNYGRHRERHELYLCQKRNSLRRARARTEAAVGRTVIDGVERAIDKIRPIVPGI